MGARGPQDALDGARKAQDSPKVGARWPRMAPRWLQGSPRLPQDGPKRAQTDPDLARQGSKKARADPKMTLDGHKLAEHCLRWPYDGPRLPQDGAKLPQEGPSLSQNDGPIWQISAYMQRDTMYMRFKQATGKQQQAYTHGNGMQQHFCTVNQTKAKLPARCIYTSCHVKVPTAAVSVHSALGYFRNSADQNCIKFGLGGTNLDQICTLNPFLILPGPGLGPKLTKMVVFRFCVGGCIFNRSPLLVGHGRVISPIQRGGVPVKFHMSRKPVFQKTSFSKNT